MMFPRATNLFDLLFVLMFALQSASAWPSMPRHPLASPPWTKDHGHNELFMPTPDHIIPGKQQQDSYKSHHYCEPHHNDAVHGEYKSAPCPALNTLANRGFIPRSGKHITYENLAQASCEVYNFGEDNVGTGSVGSSRGLAS